MAPEHKQQQNPPWVPTEIIVQIMLKLPVESLLRCKCVCKQWYTLISNQGFIKSHLTLAPCNTHCRLISIDDHSKSFRLYDHVIFGKSVNVIELDNPFTRKGATARIIGSCNGLLCIIVNEFSIFIWNPATRRVNRLPYCGFRGMFSNEYVGFGFGYDDSNDDYKVVTIYGCQKRQTTDKVTIYSLKSGCWKTLGDFPHGFPRQTLGIFVNGALHWMTGYKGRKWTIVSFDLANETFGKILQPVYDKGHKYLRLCTLGECLSVLCHYRGNRSDVWVMKVYGVQDSWTKLVSIPHVTTTMIAQCLMAMCITHDGKYLLQLEKELVLYDSKNDSFSKIQKFDNYCRAHTFVESLVSPMPINVN